MVLPDHLIADFVRDSNWIEGITVVTSQEIEEFKRFMALPEVALSDLIDFVKVYQPNAVPRDCVGLDVRIGQYTPPPGGPTILVRLEELVYMANAGIGLAAWHTHVEYENLHPFTDGNGRSGRMLWYWMMRNNPLVKLGFLHAFYYQTLSHSSLPINGG